MNEVFQPQSLENGDFEKSQGLGVSAFKLAVFGKPIGHSKSPLMQNAALKYLSINAENEVERAKFSNAGYFAFEVAPENLKETLGLFHRKNFAGINLTIPHKEIAVHCVDEIDADAKRAGACNTLVRTQKGWRGFNTDGFGLLRAVETNFARTFAGANVVIIGAGGAARGAAFYLASLGLQNASGKIGGLTLVNRSIERLATLSKDLSENGFENKTFALSDSEFYKNISPNSIIVNATSIGLSPTDSSIADFSKMPEGCVFFDMPYRASSETVSVLAARRAGLCAVSGRSMLAWQGAKSLSIWTGADVEKLGAVMCAALEADAKCGGVK